MSPVRPCEIPPGSLLASYRDAGAYADCYAADVEFFVSHAAFVEAFYTTPVFKLERLILAAFASRPSTDAEAAQMAKGESDRFAAWTVEGRAPDQVLLRDLTGRTRSWLMTAPAGSGTQLYFGSAVVPRRDSKTGEPRMGAVFTGLLGFHRIYSRVLLSAARSRLA
jgi:hypothetical protein